ncbi:hypothetical protein BO71DRAFT_215400 [Aspergillus ellipticus CBS 707.79]|uniref:Uncharacterized protein n=1 Tax=Aspergillus ellipticus CBS 707.79 TaxID=1448320 RepID=A0A319DCA7_9EURO|nr:hypothetical protein BO71DRAFT_215400 [Aspergillus ellipticus CBS 707.79]
MPAVGTVTGAIGRYRLSLPGPALAPGPVFFFSFFLRSLPCNGRGPPYSAPGQPIRPTPNSPGRPSPPLPLRIQASEKPKSVLASPLASSRLQEPFARYFFFLPPFLFSFSSHPL